MARSGTTLVSHLLGSLDSVHLEIEPHVLWKAGNFRHLSDNEFSIRPQAVDWIRRTLLAASGEKTLIEKSPVNCIRPALVHAVFPEARIVYVERDPVCCVNSNLKRSLTRDSFRFSIIFRKYFRYTGSEDLNGAIGKRKLHQQLRLADLPMFLIYSLRMMWLRNVRNLLPFGPKLKGFQDTVAREGLVGYHVNVMVEAVRCKKMFRELYGPRFKTFQLEELQRKPEEIRRLYDYCGFSVSDKFIHQMMETFNAEKVSFVSMRGENGQEIEKRLAAAGVIGGQSEPEKCS